MKTPDTESWILNSGSWVLLVLAAFLGIVGAQFVIGQNEAITYTWFSVARLVFAAGLAVGVVYQDSHRGKAADRRIRLPQRLLKMFSAGNTVVILPAAAWEIVKILSQAVVK